MTTPRDYAPLIPHFKRLRALKRSADVAGLIAELESSHRAGGSSVKQRAARYLGDLRPAEAVGPLIKALDDPDEGVRISVAVALGQIGRDDAVPRLLRLLKDSDGMVRAAAIGSLGRIGDPNAVPHIIPFLEDKRSRWTRAPALFALTVIDDSAGQAAADEALAREGWFQRRAVRRDAQRQRQQTHRRAS